LQKAHAHVANQRKDFQHQESYKLVRDFGTIVVEDLNVKGLSGGMLSKAVHDVGWSSFTNKLSYKAENAGRQLLKVDPNYTSQECPNCHTIEKKQLSRACASLRLRSHHRSRSGGGNGNLRAWTTPSSGKRNPK